EVINITTTADSIGDQLVLIMESDSAVHSISGTGIDFSAYFPNGTFQFTKATRFFIFDGEEFVASGASQSSGGGGSGWSLTGDAGTVAGTNFIGTIDSVDWVIKTNNTQKIKV